MKMKPARPVRFQGESEKKPDRSYGLATAVDTR